MFFLRLFSLLGVWLGHHVLPFSDLRQIAGLGLARPHRIGPVILHHDGRGKLVVPTRGASADGPTNQSQPQREDGDKAAEIAD